MTYKYRPTYNRETQAYAYLDFDFEFRMHTPAQNAHKFLCKLIEEHVWLRIPLPTPRENKGRLVTDEITWSLAAGTLHARGLLEGLRRIGVHGMLQGSQRWIAARWTQKIWILCGIIEATYTDRRGLEVLA